MLSINVYEGIKTKFKVYNALRQNKASYVTQNILGRNKAIDIDKEVAVNREQSLTHEGGFLYLDALGGTTIISIVLLAVVTMIGSLCLEYRQACMEEAALQVAISTIEVAKSSFKTANHPQRMIISDSYGTYDFAVEQHITSETVKNQNMKKLEVKVLHENQELISLWTYLWDGFEESSVNEEAAVYK